MVALAALHPACVVLHLDRLPPSANNLFDTVGAIKISRNGLRAKTGTRRVVSRGYKQWRDAAGMQIMAQRVKMPVRRIAGPYELDIQLHEPGDRRRRDLDNYTKALSDLLVAMNVVDDDHLCEALSVRWGPVEGVEIRVTAA